MDSQRAEDPTATEQPNHLGHSTMVIPSFPTRRDHDPESSPSPASGVDFPAISNLWTTLGNWTRRNATSSRACHRPAGTSALSSALIPKGLVSPMCGRPLRPKGKTWQ